MSANEPAQDRSVVLAVVCFLGMLAIVGLVGEVFLIHSGTDPTSLLAVSSITGPAIGGLVGILATTRTNPSQPIQQAQAQGYQQAVADVHAFTTAAPAPIPGPAGVEGVSPAAAGP